MFVFGPASILHADLDSFYASVEQRDDPRLRDRPVAVGGGVVLAASSEAKAFGVVSAMGTRRALVRCPCLVLVPPRFPAYLAASRAVFAIFADTAPVVEALSIDEAFLEVGGLEHISGRPAEITRRLRARVRTEVGLPISIGVARTKFLAKVASGAAKPDGFLLVEPDRELAFLHPLPVERLWGVGHVTAAKLRGAGLRTVGDLATCEERFLIHLLGRAPGRHLHALARGSDPRPVRAGRRRRSIGGQRALGRRVRPFREIAAFLAALVDRVTWRLRSKGRRCRTVVLRLRFGDYARATRSRTIASPTADTTSIRRVAMELLEAARPMIEHRGLTLIGVSLTNLCERQGEQLVLPFDRDPALDAAVDRVKDRFGDRAVTRASMVGRSLGQSVPILRE